MGEHTSRRPRHYIIVVHGIGEQKLNQTATEVVHRFAEVRQKKPAGYYKNLLPSYLSAQSVRRGGMGHGWSEFNGIPIDPADDTYAFDGKPATETSGRNFRFVDLHWQDILQRHQVRYASPAEKWGRTVLERIDEDKGIVPKGWIPEWATPLLRSVVDTAIPVKKLLSMRNRDLAKLMFDDFLGDVHLYGDYARTRGRAVRHFHVVLDEMHVRDFIDWCHRDKDRGQHNPYRPPSYTIIAHSLGSIMSFDALVYANARNEIRGLGTSGSHPCPSLPFIGYTFDTDVERETWCGYLMPELAKTGRIEEITKIYPQLDDEFPEVPLLIWRDRVKHFITLGSPIDKYHVIWFQNYLHMGLRRKDGSTPEGFSWWEQIEGEEKGAAGWLDQPQGEGTIVHYNLCDEQDPVGHHLDIAQASVNYGRIFDTKIPVAYRDVVFRRYAVPGLAHVKYWDDSDLFKGMVREVIDGEKVEEGPDPDLTECERQKDLGGSYFLRSRFHNRKGVYEKTLEWAYFRIPFFASLLTGGLLSYGLLSWRRSGFAISSLAAIVAAILLWTCPRPMEVYAEEAEPHEERLEGKGAVLWWERWKPRRSILAHLVAGMVEWRRVLLLLSAGQSTDREECLQKGLRLAFKKGKERTGQFRKNFTKRFIVGAVILFVSALLVSPYFGFLQTAGWIGTILSMSYLATMIYVRRLYQEAIERWEEGAK
jgi:hypothetical protein